MNVVTCPGFEPRACIYLAALTTESSQLVKLREEMVKETHNGVTGVPTEGGGNDSIGNSYCKWMSESEISINNAC